MHGHRNVKLMTSYMLTFADLSYVLHLSVYTKTIFRYNITKLKIWKIIMK